MLADAHACVLHCRYRGRKEGGVQAMLARMVGGRPNCASPGWVCQQCLGCIPLCTVNALISGRTHAPLAHADRTLLTTWCWQNRRALVFWANAPHDIGGPGRRWHQITDGIAHTWPQSVCDWFARPKIVRFARPTTEERDALRVVGCGQVAEGAHLGEGAVSMDTLAARTHCTCVTLIAHVQHSLHMCSTHCTCVALIAHV
jgi:hypothetical protein